MNKFNKTALALSMTMCFVATTEAASLGQLTVTSHANQNFQATFLVHDVAPNGTALSARLAPEDIYRQYHVTMPETAKGLSLALVNKSPLTLKISGRTPAKERAFPLLVELNEGGKKTVRQYNIHLGATGTVEPVVVGASQNNVGQARPTSVVKEPEPLTRAMPVVAASKSDSVKEEVESSPLERMQSHNYNLDRPLVVEQGYTPWSLGVLYQKRYPQASVNQVLVALAMQNPEAFPAGDVRQLKTGAKITAPSKSMVMSIDRKAAQEIVQKGLRIEDVARRPMPIEATKTAPVIKPQSRPIPKVDSVVAPEIKAEKNDGVQKALSESKQEQQSPKVSQEAQPQATQQLGSQSQDQVKPQLEQAVKEPVLKNGIPVAEAPHHDGSAQLEPLEPALPQEPLAETAGVDGAQSLETAPTLEIMTEEEEVIEDESTGWYWYVLILLLLGGAGFLYWNTKKGGRVNLNSLKSLMSDKLPRSQQATKTEPKPMAVREEPVVQQPAPSSTEGQTLQEVISEPQVKVEPKPVTEPSVTKPDTDLKKEDEEASNIFDLVGENASVALDVDSTGTNSMMEAQSMKDSLDMARSFISIGAKKEAFELLQQVVAKGTPEEKAMAEMFMTQIREQQ